MNDRHGEANMLDRLNLKNSALIVIDVINSCAHPDYEDAERYIHFKKIREMVPRLAEFMAGYRSLGGRVILTTTVPWREPFLPENINRLYRQSEQARYWSEDESGRAEQLYGIESDGATVIVKDSYDAFACEELLHTLGQLDAPTLIVAGIFADGCVEASICGGFSRGFNLVIASDLIETTDDAQRQQLQELLKQRTWPLMYGPTLPSSEILAALR